MKKKKQSPYQTKVAEVMHEFKEGDLLSCKLPSLTDTPYLESLEYWF